MFRILFSLFLVAVGIFSLENAWENAITQQVSHAQYLTISAYLQITDTNLKLILKHLYETEDK